MILTHDPVDDDGAVANGADDNDADDYDDDDDELGASAVTLKVNSDA